MCLKILLPTNNICKSHFCKILIAQWMCTFEANMPTLSMSKNYLTVVTFYQFLHLKTLTFDIVSWCCHDRWTHSCTAAERKRNSPVLWESWLPTIWHITKRRHLMGSMCTLWTRKLCRSFVNDWLFSVIGFLIYTNCTFNIFDFHCQWWEAVVLQIVCQSLSCLFDTNCTRVFS